MVKRLSLAAYEVPNVSTRCPASTFDGDDLLNLIKREAEPLRLPDEGKQYQCLRPEDPVTRHSAAGSGENPGRFVQAQCLPARAGTTRYLTD